VLVDFCLNQDGERLRILNDPERWPSIRMRRWRNASTGSPWLGSRSASRS
jgi:hypothetical protein